MNLVRYNINSNNNNNRYRLNKSNKKYNFSINFDKMMSRKGTDFINSSSLETPSFNKYTPNYDFVKHSSAKISFSYHNNVVLHRYNENTRFVKGFGEFF